MLWSGAGSGNVAEDEHVPVGPITWTLGDETAYFGPGGFILTANHSAGLLWSADGVGWETIEFLADGKEFWTRSLVHDDDRWILHGSVDDVGLMWVSDDGRTWSPVEFPSRFDPRRQQFTAGTEGFLSYRLQTRPNDPPDQFWWSDDGAQWTPFQAEGLGPSAQLHIVGSESGFLAISKRADNIGSIVTYESADGTSWREGRIDLGTEPGDVGQVFGVDHVNGNWIVFTLTSDPDITAQMWQSNDGLSWTETDLPPSDSRPVVPVVARSGSVLYVVLESPIAEPENGTLTVWATTDGSTWEEAGSVPWLVSGFAVSDRSPRRGVYVLANPPADATLSTVAGVTLNQTTPTTSRGNEDLTGATARKATEGFVTCLRDRGYAIDRWQVLGSSKGAVLVLNPELAISDIDGTPDYEECYDAEFLSFASFGISYLINSADATLVTDTTTAASTTLVTDTTTAASAP